MRAASAGVERFSSPRAAAAVSIIRRRRTVCSQPSDAIVAVTFSMPTWSISMFVAVLSLSTIISTQRSSTLSSTVWSPSSIKMPLPVVLFCFVDPMAIGKAELPLVGLLEDFEQNRRLDAARLRELPIGVHRRSDARRRGLRRPARTSRRRHRRLPAAWLASADPSRSRSPPLPWPTAIADERCHTMMRCTIDISRKGAKAQGRQSKTGADHARVVHGS